MASTFHGDAPKARIVRKDFRGLQRVAAEAVLHHDGEAASTRVVDVQSNALANENSGKAIHRAISMLAASHWLRRKSATPAASFAASPWVTIGPSKPATFRQTK